MGPSDLNIIEMIRNAGLMVQFVLFLLFFFSVTSWAIMILKYRYFRRAFRQSAEFIDVFWDSRDFAIAEKEARLLDGSPIARVFRTGYAELRKITQRRPSNPGPSEEDNEPSGHRFSGTLNIERSLRRAINMELTMMSQLVPFLATTGNTTPFIGLFGTVWGIMNSFHGIGERESVSLAVVAPGISEALVATAAGLGVAIPAVIAFNHFMQKIRILDSELQSFSADFMNIVEREILTGKGEHE